MKCSECIKKRKMWSKPYWLNIIFWGSNILYLAWKHNVSVNLNIHLVTLSFSVCVCNNFRNSIRKLILHSKRIKWTETTNYDCTIVTIVTWLPIESKYCKNRSIWLDCNLMHFQFNANVEKEDDLNSYS